MSSPSSEPSGENRSDETMGRTRGGEMDWRDVGESMKNIGMGESGGPASPCDRNQRHAGTTA